MAGSDFDFLRLTLDGLARRQEAIANNIANAETPGYKRNRVNFEAILRQQLDRQQSTAKRLDNGAGLGLSRTHAAHLGLPAAGAGFAARGAIGPGQSGLASGSFSAGGRNDGNTVDLDQEMTELAATQIQFAGITAALTSRLRTLRSVIQNI